MTTIDIAPTPEGMRHSIKLFEEQIRKSEHLMKVAEEWIEFTDIERCVYVVPSEFPIFEAALEALQEQERQRIAHMRGHCRGQRRLRKGDVGAGRFVVRRRGSPGAPARGPRRRGCG